MPQIFAALPGAWVYQFLVLGSGTKLSTITAALINQCQCQCCSGKGSQAVMVVGLFIWDIYTMLQLHSRNYLSSHTPWDNSSGHPCTQGVELRKGTCYFNAGKILHPRLTSAARQQNFKQQYKSITQSLFSNWVLLLLYPDWYCFSLWYGRDFSAANLPREGCKL